MHLPLRGGGGGQGAVLGLEQVFISEAVGAGRAGDGQPTAVGR